MGKGEKMRVYFDTGAITRELRAFERAGRIDILHFPYDQPPPKKRHTLAQPSAANPEDLNLEPGKLAFKPDEFVGSGKFANIESIIGRENRRDVIHVDSAYKDHCQCFITSDRGDILAKRDRLEALLGIRFFHHGDEWSDFEQFLGSWEADSSDARQG
jgi:hypothetical protein